MVKEHDALVQLIEAKKQTASELRQRYAAALLELASLQADFTRVTSNKGFSESAMQNAERYMQLYDFTVRFKKEEPLLKEEIIQLVMQRQAMEAKSQVNTNNPVDCDNMH